MKRCKRCKMLKPTANFMERRRDEVSAWHTVVREWCLHCRTIEGEMGMKTKWLQETAAPETKTEVLPEVMLARAEREAWIARGRPGPERPYICYSSGHPWRPSGKMSASW